MRWIWECITVWPASSPQFIPTLKLTTESSCSFIEFFKVTLEEIEEAVKRISPDAEFYSTAESKDYKQTLALLKTKEEQLQELDEQKSKFPDSI